jgi:hypothetical protein
MWFKVVEVHKSFLSVHIPTHTHCYFGTSFQLLGFDATSPKFRDPQICTTPAPPPSPFAHFRNDPRANNLHANKPVSRCYQSHSFIRSVRVRASCILAYMWVSDSPENKMNYARHRYIYGSYIDMNYVLLRFLSIERISSTVTHLNPYSEDPCIES